MRARTPRQRREDRDAIKTLTEHTLWPAVLRGLRERQYLHAQTMANSAVVSGEDALSLVHRQQALILDMEQFLHDPVEWLVPGIPDGDEDGLE